MSPYSSEELVTRRFVLDEHPRGIINIVDATNIERNLYLTMQLMELDVPMVLALNMMDEVRQNGGSVRVNEMEEMLGIPVVPISAAKNEGIEELIDHAVHVAKYREAPGRQDFCDANDHNGAVHRCLHGIMSLIEDHAHDAGIPVRFAASKLAEGDQLVLNRLNLDQNEKETLEHIITQMEKERGLDRAAAIADMRFSFIQKVCGAAVVKPKESREHARSVAIDRILTGKYTAIPAFIGIMGLVFWLTFNVIGAFLSNLLDMGIGALTDIVDRGMTPSALIGTILLDYIVAYTVIGIAGIFRKKGYVGICCGTALAVALRFVCHFISGAIIFANFDEFVAFGASWVGHPWLYSFCYNGTYMLPELIFTVIAAVILFRLPQMKKLIADESE